jgi:hypothetical protein
VAQAPKILRLNKGSLTIIGDGWRVYIRIVGWWKPRFLVTVHRDNPSQRVEYEHTDIPFGHPEDH